MKDSVFFNDPGSIFGRLVRRKSSGMEMVQVAILIAIAIAIGLIFKTQITNFINSTFNELNNSSF